MKRTIWLGLFMVAGCGPTVEELRGQKPTFETTVAAPWDRVGSCLTRAYVDEYQVTYLPVPSEQRAELLVTLVATGPISQAKRNMYAFDMKGAGPTAITLRWDTTLPGAYERKAREVIERCGKS